MIKTKFYRTNRGCPSHTSRASWTPQYQHLRFRTFDARPSTFDVRPPGLAPSFDLRLSAPRGRTPARSKFKAFQAFSNRFKGLQSKIINQFHPMTTRILTEPDTEKPASGNLEPPAPTPPRRLQGKIPTLRVSLRLLTGNLTGRTHRIPRVYRGPNGLTGKYPPGKVHS